ncbi:ABC transporter permease [Microbacterium sp. MPKO10]|uniref:ABC transporter permease n=1 Tax=Microbacterium sp. MPKO10 TaxID=2989818 RepID=UPI0022361341|nr:ABC transporter permease [Microbacterium sp. MPKO10]MCW4456965.1 ABC transporter permease [Microbacterium sp. MPKO10]
MTEITRRTPRSNPTVNVYRAGLRRGLISARIQLTTPSEIVGTIVMMVLMVVALIFLSQGTFESAAVDLGSMGLPGVIAMGVLFSGVMGIVGVLSMDRTNGTLLRSKSVPGGTTGYLVGEITANLISTVVSALLMLIVGLALFDGLEFASPLRWLLFASVLILGLISTLAIGSVLGALVSNPKFMGFVMMPVMVLVGISGIFYPIVALPGWLQGIAQAFPLYWYGLGLRASLLPDSMAAVEIGGSWRLEWVFIVLAAWAIVCLALAPKLLGRMARRESGSTLAARRRDVQQQWGV